MGAEKANGLGDEVTVVVCRRRVVVSKQRALISDNYFSRLTTIRIPVFETGKMVQDVAHRGGILDGNRSTGEEVERNYEDYKN